MKQAGIRKLLTCAAAGTALLGLLWGTLPGTADAAPPTDRQQQEPAQDAPAAQAPQQKQDGKQPRVVETMEFADADGTTITVATFSDGLVSDFVNDGDPVFGEEAHKVLATHGISITVSPQGEIADCAIKKDSTAKMTRHTREHVDEAAFYSIQARRSRAMPSNSAAGGDAYLFAR